MDKKIKVLEVISSLSPLGGGETFAVNFSRELSNLVDLNVVILHENNRPFFLERLKEKNINVTILQKRRHVDTKNVKQLRSIIVSFDPDVVHTENNALISTFLALRKTKYRNCISVFHTMHLAPEKECSNFLVRIMYRHIFKKKNYIPVAISQKLSILSQKFFNRSNVPFINNGTDLSCFNGNIPLSKRENDIVVVARFSEEKNHQFLIPSFISLKTKIPNLKVVLVGDGPLLSNIKNLVKETKSSTYITFTGNVEKPSSIVNNSKIIVLGSLYEANPLSLIEGMSSGCIVVSSNTGGVPDIVKNNVNGFLFPINDSKTLVDILFTILSNIRSFDTISNNNMDYSKNFSMKVCADKYYRLFLNSLKRKV